MIEPAAALIGAIFGGVGLKIIESILNRSKVKNDMESQMRAELRGDVVSLKETIAKLEASLDVWRKKYYALLVAFNELSVVGIAEGFSSKVDEIRKRLD
jgi:hypothetical protein